LGPGFFAQILTSRQRERRQQAAQIPKRRFLMVLLLLSNPADDSTRAGGFRLLEVCPDYGRHTVSYISRLASSQIVDSCQPVAGTCKKSNGLPT
jgi:hypothetical protein